MNRHHLISCTLLLVIWANAPSVQAQTGNASSQTAEERLEQDFTDPLTTLPQVVVRDSYTPANYATDLQTNQFIIRPLIPRIPPQTFLPFTQLIRPTFSLVTVPSSRGGTRTEFGDLPVFDLAVLPWPNRQKTGILIGIGPTIVLPTAPLKAPARAHGRQVRLWE
jgi:hypothetical protein